MHIPEQSSRRAEVPPPLAGQRLDQVAATLFAEFSRTRLQRWMREGKLRLNGQNCEPRQLARAGDLLLLQPEPEVEGDWLAVDLPLSILFEDDTIIVVDKPVGLVVHPAAGHENDTLLNGLLAHCPQLQGVPRAGIVHRIDRDTSGLLVVAKTLQAQHALVRAIQRREISREYLAVVNGVVISGGEVDRPIGRHPRDRQRMAVLESGGKEARTEYRVAERFRAHTLLALKLHSGRTHQIRVHMASIGFPVVGDPVYGGRVRLPRGATAVLREFLAGFRRQALHARRLRLSHPRSGESLEFVAPLPPDFERLLALLRQDHEVRDDG